MSSRIAIVERQLIPWDSRGQLQQGLQIFRIYEYGEILAFLRLAVESAYPVSRNDSWIIEVRYDVLDGNVLDQHSLMPFACKLREQAMARS